MTSESSTINDMVRFTIDNIVNATESTTYDSFASASSMESSTEIFDFNSTVPDLNNITSGQKATLQLYDYLIPSFGALIIALNLAVVISSGLILKKGQQPRSTYLFLGNVAMSDLVTGVAVVFGLLYPNKYRDSVICAIQIGMIVSSTLASVYSVGLIAIDRFLYILHGLQYQRWVYPMRARLLIGTSWLIGLVIGFLPLMGWAGDTRNGKICWFILLAPKELIFLTVIIGGIPLLTVLVLYSIILYHAIKKIIVLQRSAAAEAENRVETTANGLRILRGRARVNVSDSENEEGPTRQQQEQTEKKSLFKKIFAKKPAESVKSPSKWRAIKVVMFTSGSFLFTWGPYFIVSIIYTRCDDFESPRCKNLSFLIASPLAILGFLNSLINPIIYAWWHQGFRTFITKKLNTLRKKRQNAVGPSSSKDSKDTSTSDTRKTSTTSSTDSKVHLKAVVHTDPV